MHNYAACCASLPMRATRAHTRESTLTHDHKSQCLSAFARGFASVQTTRHLAPVLAWGGPAHATGGFPCGGIRCGTQAWRDWHVRRTARPASRALVGEPRRKYRCMCSGWCAEAHQQPATMLICCGMQWRSAGDVAAMKLTAAHTLEKTED